MSHPTVSPSRTVNFDDHSSRAQCVSPPWDPTSPVVLTGNIEDRDHQVRRRLSMDSSAGRVMDNNQPDFLSFGGTLKDAEAARQWFTHPTSHLNRHISTEASATRLLTETALKTLQEKDAEAEYPGLGNGFKSLLGTTTSSVFESLAVTETVSDRSEEQVKTNASVYYGTSAKEELESIHQAMQLTSNIHVGRRSNTVLASEDVDALWVIRRQDKFVHIDTLQSKVSPKAAALIEDCSFGAFYSSFGDCYIARAVFGTIFMVKLKSGSASRHVQKDVEASISSALNSSSRRSNHSHIRLTKSTIQKAKDSQLQITIQILGRTKQDSRIITGTDLSSLEEHFRAAHQAYLESAPHVIAVTTEPYSTIRSMHRKDARYATQSKMKTLQEIDFELKTLKDLIEYASDLRGHPHFIDAVGRKKKEVVVKSRRMIHSLPWVDKNLSQEEAEEKREHLRELLTHMESAAEEDADKILYPISPLFSGARDDKQMAELIANKLETETIQEHRDVAESNETIRHILGSLPSQTARHWSTWMDVHFEISFLQSGRFREDAWRWARQELSALESIINTFTPNSPSSSIVGGFWELTAAQVAGYQNYAADCIRREMRCDGGSGSRISRSVTMYDRVVKVLVAHLRHFDPIRAAFVRCRDRLVAFTKSSSPGRMHLLPTFDHCPVVSRETICPYCFLTPSYSCVRREDVCRYCALQMIESSKDARGDGRKNPPNVFELPKSILQELKVAAGTEARSPRLAATCDVCRGDISFFEEFYECLDCINYHMCHACKQKKKHQQSNPDHQVKNCPPLALADMMRRQHLTTSEGTHDQESCSQSGATIPDHDLVRAFCTLLHELILEEDNSAISSAYIVLHNVLSLNLQASQPSSLGQLSTLLYSCSLRFPNSNHMDYVFQTLDWFLVKLDQDLDERMEKFRSFDFRDVDILNSRSCSGVLASFAKEINEHRIWRENFNVAQSYLKLIVPHFQAVSARPFKTIYCQQKLFTNMHIDKNKLNEERTHKKYVRIGGKSWQTPFRERGHIVVMHICPLGQEDDHVVEVSLSKEIKGKKWSGIRRRGKSLFEFSNPSRLRHQFAPLKSATDRATDYVAIPYSFSGTRYRRYVKIVRKWGAPLKVGIANHRPSLADCQVTLHHAIHGREYWSDTQTSADHSDLYCHMGPVEISASKSPRGR